MHHATVRSAALCAVGATLGVGTLPAAAVTTLKPTVTCSSVSAPAAFAQPIYSDLPPIAAAEGLSGTTKVKIELASDGSVVAATVYAGSGADILDRAALQLVRSARYVPETANCTHVPSSSIAEVQFGT